MFCVLSQNYQHFLGKWYIHLKGSQLGVFCPQAIGYCYHEFKLRYFKNQKLFSVRVKELFEPIVPWKKGDGFLLFLKSVFLTNQSLSNARWFYGKNTKLGREICIQLKSISWNEMCCAADNHNCVTHVQKNF